MRWLTCMLVVLVAAPLAAGCSDDDGDDATTFTVFAASSTRAAMTKAAEQFVLANPRLNVKFDFDESGELLRQLEDGDPADVFAAHEPAVSSASGAGLLVGEPRRFARDDAASTLLAAVVEHATHADAARLFVEYLVSAEGQRVLQENGLLTPE